jgi:hypothetical protein
MKRRQDKQILVDGIVSRGAACIFAEGGVTWFGPGDDNIHRVGGPAVIETDGEQRWYRRGVRHRLDGPALIRPDGQSSWWQGGVHLHDREGHR